MNPKQYRTFEEACKYRRNDETIIYDMHTGMYRNIKMVRDLNPFEYEVNRPK